MIKTRFILIHTSHAGNVGATARAMKVMDFDELVLVAPRWPNVLRREETIQRASGALDVLAKARIVETLDEALEGVHHLCATAMTPRDFGPPTSAPRPWFEQLLASGWAQAASPGDEVPCMGFLFGSERYGMRNEDVYRCHVALQIPTNPHFGSLNLASAVQVIAYDWRMALGGFGSSATELASTPDSAFSDEVVPKALVGSALADAGAITGMLTHWEQALVALEYLDPAIPRKLMPRLNQLVNRAGVKQEEIQILRGIAKAILSKTAPSAAKG
jgi:tRNA/rRNA methyltransferase